MEGLYYLCSENKGADQLRGYREADLRLCFPICKKPVFSRRGSFDKDHILKDQSDYTHNIYADGNVVFVFPFDGSSIMFICSSSYHDSGIYCKVLHLSFSSGVYLSNHSSENIHIWTIVTLEGWHSLHDPGPKGPCLG